MKYMKALLCGLTLASGATQAAMIDFTAATWQDTLAGDSASSKTRTFGDVEVNIRAYNQSGLTNLTFGAFGGAASAPCGTLLSCATGGGGVEDGQVTFGEGNKSDVERLEIRFSKALDITNFHFLDLFVGGTDVDPELERAQWQINGAIGGTFDGYDPSGYAVTGELGYFGVSKVEFYADTARTSSSPNTDFALAGIQVSSVPEPTTVALLGLGLVGLSLRKARK